MSSYPGAAKNHEEINAATAKIESSDPSVVIQGLNALTKKSFEALETHSVHFENHPQLAISIGSLLDVINPLTTYVFGCEDAVDSSEDATGQWAIKLPCEGNQYIKGLAFGLDDNTLLLSTLNILRNLSFDVVNEQVMGASTPFLQHLVALLVISIESGSSFQATHLATEVLINIGAKIDFTGKKRLQGYYFSEDASRLKTSTDTLQKNLLLLRVNRHMSAASSQEYLAAVAALMSVVTLVISGRAFPDRSLTLRTVELLGRLAGNVDNSAYLARSPDVLFESLVQLLCTSTTFAEPLVSDTYHVNGDPLGRRRAPAAVCLSNKQAIVVHPTAPTTTLPGQPTNNANNNANNNAPTYNITMNDTPAVSSNITFGGQRLDAGAAGSGSVTNLEGLNSQASSASLSQRPGQTGAAGLILAGPALQASFFTEYSDLEMRDQVLDTLHALCLLGPVVQVRLVRVPRVVEVLFRIVSSTSPAAASTVGGMAGGAPGGSGSGSGGAGTMGGYSGAMGGASNSGIPTVARTEGVIKALQILSLLLALPEAGSAFLAMQSEFIAAACSDDFIAEVVCNKALPVQQDLRARLAYSTQQTQLEQQFAAESQQAMMY